MTGRKKKIFKLKVFPADGDSHPGSWFKDLLLFSTFDQNLLRLLKVKEERFERTSANSRRPPSLLHLHSSSSQKPWGKLLQSFRTFIHLFFSSGSQTVLQTNFSVNILFDILELFIYWTEFFTRLFTLLVILNIFYFYILLWRYVFFIIFTHFVFCVLCCLLWMWSLLPWIYLYFSFFIYFFIYFLFIISLFIHFYFHSLLLFLWSDTFES